MPSDNIYDMCGGDGLAAAQGEPRADGAAGVYAPMNDRAKTALTGGLRNAALVTTFRWPLSAALLLAFETVVR